MIPIQASRFLVGFVKLVALIKIFSVFGANEVGALAKLFLIYSFRVLKKQVVEVEPR